MLLDLIKISEETYETRLSDYTSTLQPEYELENTTRVTTQFRYLNWTEGEKLWLKIYNIIIIKYIIKYIIIKYFL